MEEGTHYPLDRYRSDLDNKKNLRITRSVVVASSEGSEDNKDEASCISTTVFCGSYSEHVYNELRNQVDNSIDMKSVHNTKLERLSKFMLFSA